VKPEPPHQGGPIPLHFAEESLTAEGRPLKYAKQEPQPYSLKSSARKWEPTRRKPTPSPSEEAVAMTQKLPQRR
jgi:hypothetical protein